MKRIFIAVKVEPGETLSGLISTFKAGLSKDSIKWTNPGNIHITLAFLGDTDDKMIEPISSMLHGQCKKATKFELVLKGSGVFRNMNDPRIIWTGIEPSEKLNYLNKVIVAGLKELNIKLEDRPFNPHLTLGRIKHLNDKETLTSLIGQYHNKVIQIVKVDEIILYESILLQTGPVYKPLEKIGLL
jgi:RNA 2',3'-cyclic 3'-phosphodiesterase